MNNILHVICLLFTLLITLWCVHKYKEGFNDNTLFTECRNNTEWYVENEEGERFYCDDIGNGASCYDMNERYVEGWEVCHRSCGNCRDTQVTTSNQQQLAGYYGDSNDFFVSCCLEMKIETGWERMNVLKENLWMKIHKI